MQPPERSGVLASTMRFPEYGRGPRLLFHRVAAAIARGKHPVPSRTRKLSPSAPMVLRGRPRGRVGHRRTYLPEKADPQGPAFFAFRGCPRKSKSTSTAPVKVKG